MSAIGINNGNSTHARLARQDRIEYTLSPRRMSVTRDDLEALAVWVAAKYQLSLFHNNEIQIAEFENQLVIVRQYAEDLAEVMS
jgi:hypothetical protein